MHNPFRRWFGGSRGGGDGLAAVAAWAEGAGHRFARSRDGSGFVIEPAQAAASWRLEWGRPQRRYIDGSELRLRAEVGATGDLQMLAMTRALMTTLEQQVFTEITQGTQTRMDDATPEEMRWLVLHSKVPRAELGPLRERFGASAQPPRAALLWLEGPLAGQLEASTAWLPEIHPLVLVVQRGRLTMRCALPEPGVPALLGALALFGVALAAARRVGEAVARGAVGSERPSTWGTPSAMPALDDPPR